MHIIAIHGKLPTGISILWASQHFSLLEPYFGYSLISCIPLAFTWKFHVRSGSLSLYGIWRGNISPRGKGEYKPIPASWIINLAIRWEGELSQWSIFKFRLKHYHMAWITITLFIAITLFITLFITITKDVFAFSSRIYFVPTCKFSFRYTFMFLKTWYYLYIQFICVNINLRYLFYSISVKF